MINVCFTQTDGLSYFPEHRTENQIITISESSMIEFETILYLMERLLKQKDYLYEDAVNKYLDLLLLILNRHFSNHLTCDPLWGELLSYLSENYNTVTLQKAAEIVGISVSHFCRIFKRDFSTTFHDYVNNIRIAASEISAHTINETISWIADRWIRQLPAGLSNFNHCRNNTSNYRKSRKRIQPGNSSVHPFLIILPNKIKQTGTAIESFLFRKLCFNFPLKANNRYIVLGL